MQTAYRFRMQIPLIGQAPRVVKQVLKPDKVEHRRKIEAVEKKTRHLAFLKPGNQLGASWIDNSVVHRSNVNLCENCWRRYANWWKRYGYRGQWNLQKLSDCDGCGSTLIFVTGFYPEERYFASIINERR